MAKFEGRAKPAKFGISTAVPIEYSILNIYSPYWTYRGGPMRQTDRQRGSTTYYGGKGAQLCRVQYGSSLHQDVVSHPSHTTARLYLARYLQAVDPQPIPELVSIHHPFPPPAPPPQV